MNDFLAFRRMLTPLFIQAIFWVGLFFCLIAGFSDLFRKEFIHGLELIIGGPIVVRVFCELLILFFRMNETLTDIKDELTESEKR